MDQTSNSQFFVKTSKKLLSKELESLVHQGTRKANEKISAILRDVDPRDVVDAWGTTLLHLAAGSSNSNMIRYLIKRGCDIDAKDDLGQTPIMTALQKGYIDNVELLLEWNADIYTLDSNGQNALRMILHKPDQSYPYLVKLLLRKATAGCKSNEEIVKILRDIDCPLDCVVCLRNAEVTKTMLERGNFPEIDAKRNGDNTALHVAVFMTDADNVQALLEHDADVNALNVDGETPLMLNYFCRNDDEDLKVLDALLSRGVNLTLLDNVGKMQSYQLLTKGKAKAVRLVLQRDLLDWNARDEFYCTPLFYLINNENPYVMRELMHVKVDWNTRNASGCTVLHIAMSRGDLNIVRFLIHMGADVNAKDDNGRTPLFHAFIRTKSKQHRECVEMLLERGADTQVVSYVPDTLIELANLSFNFDTVEPILSHIALLQELGKPINDLIKLHIQSNPTFHECYYSRQQQLQQMKTDVVYGTVTMFKILTESDNKVIRYASKQETADRVRHYGNRNNSYYYEISCKRFVRAREVAVLRERAMIFLKSVLRGLDDVILHMIISYLSNRELQNF